MLTAEQNEKVTRVGPGTPMGKLLRRYWHPAGFSSDVRPGGEPRAIRILGEDLVLFRTDDGKPGVLERQCPHRGTSLVYGRAEDGGLRCTFHGWLFNVDGTCMHQPAEPEGSTFKDKVRAVAYPARDLGGLIFVYMGPLAQMPLLPNYEVLARTGGSRAYDVYEAGGNFLQHVEGALDTTHVSYLHAANWSQVKHRLFAAPKPRISFSDTPYGLWQRSDLPNITGYAGEGADPTITIYAHFIMPAGFLRAQEHRPGSGLVQKTQSWYVPVDDTHTVRYQVAFSPPWPDGRLFEWSHERSEPPTARNRYFRDYEHTDTLSGIPLNAHRSPIQAEISYAPQDVMANEEQGAILDRTREHLGAHENVVTAMRKIYFQAMDDVAAGTDPIHVLRDEAANTIVYVRGEEQGELV